MKYEVTISTVWQSGKTAAVATKAIKVTVISSVDLDYY